MAEGAAGLRGGGACGGADAGDAGGGADAGGERPRKRLRRKGWPADRRLLALRCALESTDVMLAIALIAGPLAVHALRATMRSIGQAVACVLPAVLRQCKSIYVFGGTDGQGFLSSVERFDLRTAVWEALALPMPCSRLNAAAATMNGSVYICGGVTQNQVLSLDLAERFEPVTGTWETIPKMSRKRRAAAAAVIAGRLYVCGGSVDGLFECFDFAKGEWGTLPPAPQSMGGFVAAGAVNGRLYICGGMWGGVFLAAAARFDCDAGTWEALPSMPGGGREGAGAAGAGGRLYVCGGSGQNGTLDLVERLDPEGPAWEALPPMLEARSNAVVVAAGGRIFTCGGVSASRPLQASSGEVLCSSEAFDPQVGAWAALPPMLRPRRFAAAAAPAIP